MNPNLTEIVQKIQQHTKACWESVKQPALPAPSSALSSNPFVQIQKELKQQYPHFSEHELIIKSMDFLIEQFLQTVNQNDDVSMRSGTSQTPSEPESDPVEHVLAGESQDPEDDEPHLGDFWDSLTAVIAEKITKDKDRKGKGPEY